MAEDFLTFFAQENDPSVLNIAYIITDHMFDWKYSRFLTWLKKSQSKVADLINLRQIYTKFIVYLYTVIDVLRVCLAKIFNLETSGVSEHNSLNDNPPRRFLLFRTNLFYRKPY